MKLPKVVEAILQEKLNKNKIIINFYYYPKNEYKDKIKILAQEQREIKKFLRYNEPSNLQGSKNVYQKYLNELIKKQDFRDAEEIQNLMSIIKSIRKDIKLNKRQKS